MPNNAVGSVVGCGIGVISGSVIIIGSWAGGSIIGESGTTTGSIGVTAEGVSEIGSTMVVGS